MLSRESMAASRTAEHAVSKHSPVSFTSIKLYLSSVKSTTQREANGSLETQEATAAKKKPPVGENFEQNPWKSKY